MMARRWPILAVVVALVLGLLALGGLCSCCSLCALGALAPTPTRTALPRAPATVRPTVTVPPPTVDPAPTRTATRWPTVTSQPTATREPAPSATGTPARSPTAPAPSATPRPTAAPVAQGDITAWVSDPTPSRREFVTVFARLVVDGQPVAGAPMTARWYYKSSTLTCEGVTGGDGVASCMRSIGGATRGNFVQVRVTITWQGQVYTAETGFTPK